MTRRLVVLTDVDGCLIDHATYSHAAADPAIDRLAASAVPLVLCSSKTRAELERLRRELRLTAPFVVENGAALYVPSGLFPRGVAGARRVPGYDVVEFARPRADVAAQLHETAARLGIRVVSFGGMSVERVAAECGLSPVEAGLARLRDYDEPFRLAVHDPEARRRLWRALEDAGLRCSAGGRFDHVVGGADKGSPVPTLRRLYAQWPGEVVVVGLGDSLNDLELLAAADVPVLVRNPAGASFDRVLKAAGGVMVTRQAGPAGWREAIDALLDAQGAAPVPAAPSTT